MTDSNLPATTNEQKLALMEEGARTGVESFNMKQRVVPWLRLVQSGTPFGKRSSPQYVEGCVEGDIIDTLMLKPMKQAIVIPCKYEDHYTEWTHEEDEQGRRKQGGLVRQWFNDSSKYDASDAGGKPPGWPRRTAEGNDINMTPTYYCLLVDPDSGFGRPVVLPLASTQARKSQRWNSQIDALTFKGANGPFTAPIYAQSYKL